MPLQKIGEQINNPSFKLVEFDRFWKNAGGNAFVLTPQKWIQIAGGGGLVSKAGLYSSWING